MSDPLQDSPRDPQNPYAPPSTAGEWAPGSAEPEAPAHSSAPKVFGILSIIFASLILCFGLIGSCSGLAAQGIARFGEMAPENGTKAQEIKVMMGHLATVYTAIGVQSLVLALMSALLLAIGIGQVRYRAWAGRWTVYWAGLALAVVVGMVALSFLVIGPAYQQMFESAAANAPSGTLPSGLSSSLGGMFGGTFSSMTVFFYAPYPILLLIFFTKQRVRATMTR